MKFYSTISINRNGAIKPLIIGEIMRISLSTLNQIFQTISTIFQEVLAFEGEQTKSTKESTPPSEVPSDTNKLLP